MKRAVQPELDQDFDALFEEFVAEHGARDVAPFLIHLHDFGLISDHLLQQIQDDSTLGFEKPEPSGAGSAPKPIDWGDEEPEPEEDATVLASARELIEMSQAAASTSDSKDKLGMLPSFDEPPEQDESSKKRTMFRRRDDGQWTETGAFEKPKRRRRRRRTPTAHTRNDSRYGFKGMVGEGAMGTVLLAEDKQLHRTIAYKEMSADIAEQPALASKFAAEAQITAQLEHPNIVPVYALEGTAAYTMKLIRGRTVEDLITETKELYSRRKTLDEDHSLEGRLEIFLKVCDAIAFAHSRGVVHRDLKPENIMLGEFGEVYVMDWGIAHLMQGEYEARPTVRGMADEGDLIIGTAGYMSPEQAEGKTDELSGASDQYALGLILFELISLREAVSGKNRLHMLTRQQEGEIDRLLHAYREPIPSELAAIVRKATRLHPEQRFASVDALGDDIRRHLRGEAVQAKPDNPWQALVRWTGRHRQATLLAAMMVLFSSFMFVMFIGIWAQIALSRAAAREQTVSNFVSEVSRQASQVDAEFQRLEGLLAVLAASAEDLLVLGDPEGRIYMVEDFKDTGPSDVEDSKRYRIPVSLEKSAFITADDTPESARFIELPKLDPMNRHYKKIMLRSLNEDAAFKKPKAAARAIRDVGTPIVWAYIGLESGAYNIYPGHHGYLDGYDPREKSWYKRAAKTKGPRWSVPMSDDDGGRAGTVMPCSIPLRDRQNNLLGVAGIDVSFRFVVDMLLDADLERAGAQAYILDEQGQVLVDPVKMRRGEISERQLFDDSDVVSGLKTRESGVIENGGELVVYTRMSSSSWFYVVRGPAEALLATM